MGRNENENKMAAEIKSQEKQKKIKDKLTKVGQNMTGRKRSENQLGHVEKTIRLNELG